jgi:ABC-type multidrug transport system fused ATPase/permease subunit
LLDQAKEQAAPSRGVINKRIETGITFNNVSFGYSPDVPIFTDLNLILPRGKMTALVGKSGAGKTTIVDLAVGLYRPWKGIIRVDDIPMTNLDLFGYRKKIAYVGQEPFLFHDSVRNNLTFGLAFPVTDEELKTVCETVGAWSFIVARSEGLDSILGDRAVQLSGGQRQRLALARALLRRPELMILDEATSALDSETEIAIAHVLTQIQKRGDVTILIIAHRYTTIRSADNIIEIGTNGAKELGTWEVARGYLDQKDNETKI